MGLALLAHSAHGLLEPTASAIERFPVLPPGAPGTSEEPQAAPNRRRSSSRGNTCDVSATPQQHKQMLWAAFDVFLCCSKQPPLEGLGLEAVCKHWYCC